MSLIVLIKNCIVCTAAVAKLAIVAAALAIMIAFLVHPSTSFLKKIGGLMHEMCLMLAEISTYRGDDCVVAY